MEEIIKSAVYKKPYINIQGDLVIPFDSDPKYHWWNGGQSVHKTLLELNTSPEIIKKYVKVNES